MCIVVYYIIYIYIHIFQYICLVANDAGPSGVFLGSSSLSACFPFFSFIVVVVGIFYYLQTEHDDTRTIHKT